MTKARENRIKYDIDHNYLNIESNYDRLYDLIELPKAMMLQVINNRGFPTDFTKATKFSCFRVICKMVIRPGVCSTETYLVGNCGNTRIFCKQ